MKLYSTAEAASYLGRAEATVRHHVYNTGRLEPRKVHRKLVFTQEQLDRFVAEGPRKSGRKRRETDGS